MNKLIAVSSTSLQGNGIYRRLLVGNPASRAERRELLALDRHAHRGQLEAIIAPPRLRRTDIRPLECLSLGDVLGCQPAVDPISVELTR